MVRPGGVRQNVHMALAADIAGIDAQGGQPRFQRGHGQPVVEVDIRDQGERGTFIDETQRGGRSVVRHGQPGDLAAGVGQGAELAQRGVRVTGIGVGHALYEYGMSAAQRQGADFQNTGMIAVGHVVMLPFPRGGRLPHAASAPEFAGRPAYRWQGRTRSGGRLPYPNFPAVLPAG